MSRTGSTRNSKAAHVVVILCMAAKSSVSTSMKPPQSPARTRKWWTLTASGIVHSLNTAMIRFCKASYSADDPIGRSYHVIIYFIVRLLCVAKATEMLADGAICSELPDGRLLFPYRIGEGLLVCMRC